MARIVLEVPEEIKGMVPALENVIDVVMTQVDRGHAGGQVDYAAFQRQLAEKLGEVERRADEAALAALDVHSPRVLINKVLHVKVLRCETTFMGLAGPACVMRSLYRPAGERNAPTVDLVALRAGAIEDVWLPATAREMAFDVQQLTSREAETRGRRMGRLPYSHTSFEHVAHAVGETYVGQHQQIEQALIEAFEVPKEARDVSASLDRVSVPMEEPRSLPAGEPANDAPVNPIARVYRMAYCGTVTLHDADGEALHTIRYGSMPEGDPEALCAGMADDVIAMLSQRPDLKLSLLCDGAKEMWNLLDAEFTKAPFDAKHRVVSRLIDIWHLLEKLAPATKVIVEANEAKPLLARWKILLLNASNARKMILDVLVASGKEDVKVGETTPVHDAITYLTNNVDRMDYAAARRDGLPIGSGAVDATCKSLFNLRMNRSGSRWKSQTGEHIVHLRSLALSDRWDPAMDLALKQPRISIRAAA